jgi:hypothetical protein
MCKNLEGTQLDVDKQQEKLWVILNTVSHSQNKEKPSNNSLFIVHII